MSTDDERPGNVDEPRPEGNATQPPEADAVSRLRARARQGRSAASPSATPEAPAQEPGPPEPAQTEPAQSEASQSEASPVEDEPTEPGTTAVETESEPEPAEPDAAEPDAAEPDAAEADAAEPDAAEPGDASAATTSDVGTPASRRRGRLAAVAIALVLAVLASVLAGIVTQRASTHAAARAAKPAIISATASTLSALLSYDYRNFADNEATARAGLTKSFGATYAQHLTQQVEPTAVKYQAVVTAVISSLSIVSNTATSATVLAFSDQTLSDTAIKGQQTSATRERVVLVKQRGKWLISSVVGL